MRDGPQYILLLVNIRIIKSNLALKQYLISSNTFSKKLGPLSVIFNAYMGLFTNCVSGQRRGGLENADNG